MSAWLCSEEHINLLVNASDDPHCEDNFKMLVKENIRSLGARYPGRDFLDGWKKDARRFKFKSHRPAEIVTAALANDPHRDKRGPINCKDGARITATQILKACACYDYQACETDDYYDTKAAKFVNAVREKYLSKGEAKGSLYDAMLWGL
jgi:hypothetical protein